MNKHERQCNHSDNKKQPNCKQTRNNESVTVTQQHSNIELGKPLPNADEAISQQQADIEISSMHHSVNFDQLEYLPFPKNAV